MPYYALLYSHLFADGKCDTTHILQKALVREALSASAKSRYIGDQLGREMARSAPNLLGVPDSPH